MKLVLFLAAIALLYLGPLFAGLIHAPAAALPVFVAIFLLWHVVMRPLPRGLAAWLGTALVQLVLVGVCWGLGRMLALALPAPDLTMAWPLTLSALSIPLSRLARARPPAGIDALLDDAIAEIENATPPSMPPANDKLSTRDTLLVDLACTAITNLPADAGLAEVETVTAGITRPAAIFALIDRLKDAPDTHAPNILAQAMLAFRPEFLAASRYDDDQWEVLDRALATDNPHLIGLTADLATEAFRHDPALNLPGDTELLSAAARLADQGNEAAAHSLRALVKARGFARDTPHQEGPLE